MYKNPGEDVKRKERKISRVQNTGKSITKQKAALWQTHVRKYPRYKSRESESIVSWFTLGTKI
jgi:hypothetical protein